MSKNFVRFEKSTPVVDGEITPLPFLEWIKQANLDITLASKYKTQYTKYVSNWYKAKKKTDDAKVDIINERYTTFLNEIEIQYKSDEEKRFLSNIDFNNKQDLEVAIPYIARSIQDTISSHHSMREDIKFQKIKYSLAGTRYGLDKIIRNIIYNALKTPNIRIKYESVFDKIPIKTIVNELVVNVREFYDMSQDYYDNDIQTDNKTLREKFQNQTFDRQVITDVSGALTTLENQQTVLSDDDSTQVITSNLTPLLIQSTTTTGNKQYPANNYSDYNITNNTNTNFQGINNLVYDKLGTDLYTIVTDANSDYTLSKISTKKNNYNLLNLFYPTINYIPASGADVIPEKAAGLFFKPINTAIQRYYSHSITPVVIKDKLKANATYVLPDIYTYGNIANNTVSGLDLPIRHVDDTNWVKSDVNNYERTGHINNSKNHNKFYGYVSTNESQDYLEKGLARSTDDYDFWSGSKDSIWSQPDLFPETNPYNYDYNSKLTNMLPITGINELATSHHKGVVTQHTDIYGHEWYLLKVTDQFDRATQEAKDAEARKDTGVVTCTYTGGEDFTVNFDSNTVTVSGGGFTDTAYVPRTLLTDWFNSLDNITCTDVRTANITYNCNRYNGAFFMTSNLLNTLSGDKFNPTATPTLTANCGTFLKTSVCDSTTADAAKYNINSKLSLFALGDEYYDSVLMPGLTSVDYLKSQAKRNRASGELWSRSAVTGTLTKHSDNVRKFNIYGDIIKSTENNPRKRTTQRIENNWDTGEPSLVPF
jgi:hypothetical protein